MHTYIAQEIKQVKRENQEMNDCHDLLDEKEELTVNCARTPRRSSCFQDSGNT